jgi:hypothetical protein
MKLFTYLPMKMEQTECSETSAYKIQTPGNYPEENIEHTEHCESLKSRIHLAFFTLIIYTIFFSLTLCKPNISLFLTRSVQLIFPILVQHHILKLHLKVYRAICLSSTCHQK